MDARDSPQWCWSNLLICSQKERSSIKRQPMYMAFLYSMSRKHRLNGFVLGNFTSFRLLDACAPRRLASSIWEASFECLDKT